jgi:hypothetical protein
VLALYLDSLVTAPALARTFLVEVYGAGPDAVRRRAAVLDRFADLFAELLDARDGERRFACDAYVAAISSMVTMRVATGETDDLPALREPLVRLAGQLFGEDAR